MSSHRVQCVAARPLVRRAALSLLSLLVLFTIPACEVAQPREHALLVRGERAYAQGRFSTATHQLTAMLDEVAAGPLAGRAHYVRGLAYARIGKRSLAYNDLEKATATGDREIAWRSHAVLGVMRFEDGDWSSASRHLTQAINLMPQVPPMDALLYRQGLCRERLGQWRASLDPYLAILDKFPQGRYADLATRRVELRADHFAVQAGVFQSRERATELAGELRAGNLPARVEQQPRDGQPYHVVVVGRYRTYDEARRYLGRVRGYVPDAQIWP